MPDDVLLNKCETIERCLIQVKSYYQGGPHQFRASQICQDAILLNIERACQAAIDAAMRWVRLRGLGIPKETREVFEILEKGKLIPIDLATNLKKMVGFRNIAIHDYRKLDLDLVQRLIESDFVDLRKFIKLLLQF